METSSPGFFFESCSPKKTHALVEVPEMVFLEVEGKGNPNTSEDYAQALELLYGLSYGIKMRLKFGTVPGELS